MDHMRICMAVVFGCLLASAPVLAKDQQGKFTLDKLVPADSVLYVHCVHNPEREFLEKHWSRVWEALKNSGIDADIKALMKAQYGTTEEQQADFDARWGKTVQLCKSVHWGDLMLNETAVFVRSLQDVSVLFRPKKETLDANVQSLVAILEELASLCPDARVDMTSTHGGKVWTLRASGCPVSISLFHRGEVVGLSINSATVDELLAVLAGERKTTTLVDTPRYRQAMSQLPKPEDAIMFIDVNKMFSSMRQYAQPEAHSGGSDGSGVDHQAQTVSILIDQLDFVDYIATTEQTEGLKTLAHSVTKLSEGARTKKLCKALVNQKAVTGVLEHVPQDATGYFAWSGVDLDVLYSFIKDMVERSFDEGPGWLATWAEWQQNNEFNLQEDFLSWIDGQVITMSFPPAIQTGFGAGDFVAKIKVRDDGKARESINRQVDRFSETLLTTPAAEINADGFRSVTHPMVAMFLKLTYGVQDGWLYIGNSSAAINKCLATARSEAPSFAANERFKSEGVIPKGPVSSASFADTSNWGQEVAMGLGMGMPMLAAMIPPTPENEEARSVFAVLGKLAPVFAHMNFERSRSSVCRLEGDRWLTESVINYKEYVPPKQVPDLAETRRQKETIKSQLEGL